MKNTLFRAVSQVGLCNSNASKRPNRLRRLGNYFCAHILPELRPLRLAAYALVFVSAAANVRYGWSLGNGSDFDASLWATASLSSDLFKAGAALMIADALAGKAWLRALGVAGLLAITATYSAVSAVGFASTTRDAAIATRSHGVGAYQRALASYEQKAAALDAVGRGRSLAVVEAEMTAARPSAKIMRRTNHCTDVTRSDSAAACSPWQALGAEAQVSRERARAEGEVATAKAALDAVPVPSALTADPQAKTLQNYLGVVGVAASESAVRDGLTLLLILLVEAGAILGLWVTSPRSQSVSHLGVPRVSQARDSTQGGGVALGDDAPQLPMPTGGTRVSELLDHPSGRVSAAEKVVALARESGGVLRGTQRALGNTLGLSAATVNRALADLEAVGVVTVHADRQEGTVVRLVSEAVAA